MKTNELKFCSNCHTMSNIKFGTIKYNVQKEVIKSFQKVMCSNCSKERNLIIRKYSKKTPVNLIVGKYTRKMIKGYISDRAEIDRKVLRHFTKPQLRRYLIKGKFPLHIHWIEVKKGEIVKVKCTKCQYEMIKETPIAMKIMRKIFWEQWIKYGKMSSSWKEGKKQPHLDQVYCKEHERKENVSFVLVGGVKTAVRVCENHWFIRHMKSMGWGKKQYQDIDMTNYIPLTEKEKQSKKYYSISRKKYVRDNYDNFNHEIRNANLKEVKFCGTDLCPNRFQYITRPDKLNEIFGKGMKAT